MTSTLPNDQSEWTERSQHWLEKAINVDNTRALRDRQRKPIILNGDGVHLRLDKGTLHIRNGFTHYPQEQESYRFFRGDLNLPTRIVAVDCSGGLSFDVLAWLAEQGVSLVCVDWKGDALSVLACNGYAADRDKVAWQVATRSDEAARVAFSTVLIARKLRSSLATLNGNVPASQKREFAIAKANAGLSLLSEKTPNSIEELRAIEATAANAYFAAWRGLPMRWKGTSRHPIPDAWHTFETRSSFANGTKPKNVNASHALNALLNFAYGSLQHKLHIQAVADGLDPTLGIMHHGRREAAAYIFDVMEPERPKVDAHILAFVADNVFSGGDFIIREDGCCRLSPQLARYVTGTLASFRCSATVAT